MKLLTHKNSIHNTIWSAMVMGDHCVWVNSWHLTNVSKLGASNPFDFFVTQKMARFEFECQCGLSTGWWFPIFFDFNPSLGKIPILTNIFQMGWNHQLVYFLQMHPDKLYTNRFFEGLCWSLGRKAMKRWSSACQQIHVRIYTYTIIYTDSND